MWERVVYQRTDATAIQIASTSRHSPSGKTFTPGEAGWRLTPVGGIIEEEKVQCAAGATSATISGVVVMQKNVEKQVGDFYASGMDLKR